MAASKSVQAIQSPCREYSRRVITVSPFRGRNTMENVKAQNRLLE